MKTENTTQYRKMQEPYLKKRQDEIWTTVRRLTSRPRPTPDDTPRTESSKRFSLPHARTEQEGSE